MARIAFIKRPPRWFAFRTIVLRTTDYFKTELAETVVTASTAIVDEIEAKVAEAATSTPIETPTTSTLVDVAVTEEIHTTTTVFNETITDVLQTTGIEAIEMVGVDGEVITLTDIDNIMFDIPVIETKSTSFNNINMINDKTLYNIVHVAGDKDDYKVDNDGQKLILKSKHTAEIFKFKNFNRVAFSYEMMNGFTKTLLAEAEGDKTLAKLAADEIVGSISNITLENKFEAYFKACIRQKVLGNPLGRAPSMICEMLLGKN